MLSGVDRKWDNKWEYILVSVTILIGFNNFWRFPFLVLRHGGLAFIIPYLCFVLVTGVPMYYLDLSIGQFSARGTIVMFYNLAPAWSGVGVTQCIICFFLSSVAGYNMSISLFYFVQSFQSVLPWTECDKDWENCINSFDSVNSSVNNTDLLIPSSKFYFDKIVLNRADLVEGGVNNPQYHLILGVAIGFLLCNFIMILGIKSVGKVSYFSATLPYIVLFVLFVRSMTLDGASTGINFIFKSDWTQLKEAETWLNAATHCFLTFGIGSGVISTYASYQEVHQNNQHIPFIVLFADLIACVLSTFTIFATLGHYSKRTGVDLENIYPAGKFALAYISFADAVASFETANYVFSVVFYLMISIACLGGLVAFQQVLTTNMMEFYSGFKEWHVSLITCTVGFLSSIIYTTRAGLAIKNVIDMYGVHYPLLVVGSVEIIAVIYVYGLQYWSWDIQYMNKVRTGYYWRWGWTLFSPACLICVYIYACFITTRMEYNHRSIPWELYIFANLLLLFVVCPICVMFIYHLLKHRGLQGLAKAFDSDYWLPSNYMSAASCETFREETWKNYRYKKRRKVVRDLLALFTINHYEDYRSSLENVE